MFVNDYKVVNCFPSSDRYWEQKATCQIQNVAKGDIFRQRDFVRELLNFKPPGIY